MVGKKCLFAKLQIKPNENHLLKTLEVSIFAQLVAIGCCCCCRRQAGDSSGVTLAFEDVQVIPPFSREETDNADDRYVRDDTDDTDDRDDTDDTDDTGDTDDRDDTFRILLKYF